MQSSPLSPSLCCYEKAKPDFSWICCACCRDTYNITCSCNILEKINLHRDLAYKGTPHHKYILRLQNLKFFSLCLDLGFIDWVITNVSLTVSMHRTLRQWLSPFNPRCLLTRLSSPPFHMGWHWQVCTSQLWTLRGTTALFLDLIDFNSVFKSIIMINGWVVMVTLLAHRG